MRYLKFFFATLFVMAMIIIAGTFGIGWFIAPQEKLAKTEAIVVVSGGDTDQRTDEGVRLYQQGWAPKLILVGAAADQGTSNAAVMRLRAVGEGVPVENTLIEERSTNTKENAEFLRPIFQAANIHSAILVSSPYHTRRLKTTFYKVYGDGYHFIAHPATDTRWARSSWWQSAETVSLTFDELRKTLYVTFFQ